ncbi:hypothetical protein EGR_02108 [Echinococcus granulosus]|uniref:Uncharacterized protein n=1 Tax=Echinococcus granulosus TaxID=6210 RepID=W6V8Z7_ECHGR|nr:hypothetical protein EGR_02108 [Echinococcus granulosus]EUB63014.1 hypothetical protein EGR_02108 [Echinococcus granulosus]
MLSFISLQQPTPENIIFSAYHCTINLIFLSNAHLYLKLKEHNEQLLSTHLQSNYGFYLTSIEIMESDLFRPVCLLLQTLEDSRHRGGVNEDAEQCVVTTQNKKSNLKVPPYNPLHDLIGLPPITDASTNVPPSGLNDPYVWNQYTRIH